MSVKKILGVLLIAAGVAALAHPVVPMPRESHRADLGPFRINVKESRQTEIPRWLSVIVAAIGTGVLVIEKKK